MMLSMTYVYIIQYYLLQMSKKPMFFLVSAKCCIKKLGVVVGAYDGDNYLMDEKYDNESDDYV